MTPILVSAAALGLFGSGCGPAAGTREASPSDSDLAVIAAAAPMPVVRFRLLIIRDWDSPWYVIASEDYDWTLQEAVAFGMPAELWIKCLIENPADFRQELYYVRPLHA